MVVLPRSLWSGLRCARLLVRSVMLSSLRYGEPPRVTGCCPLLAPDRLQHLLGTIEALGCRVPDLTHQILRGAVALGVGGDLLLVGWEVHALQELLKLTQVEVAKVP
jgi:hypothetical protein